MVKCEVTTFILYAVVIVDFNVYAQLRLGYCGEWDNVGRFQETRGNVAREKRYRKPDEGMLHVRQVPEVNIPFRTWWTSVQRKWKFCGQVPGIESCVSALVVALMKLPEAERIAFVGAHLPDLEAKERAWIREMDELVADGVLEVGPGGKLVPRAQPPGPTVHHAKPPSNRVRKKLDEA